MSDTPAIELDHASLRFDHGPLWEGLSLAVARGEFLAVLGPNASGKTSLLRVLLGLQRLSAGRAEVFGRLPHRGNPAIGYMPQQRAFDPDLPLRGRDLVRFGLDGNRWGFTRDSQGAERQVDEMLALLEAQAFADYPVGRLSGGEQQRLRVAQALIGRPQLLLCDEPLLSLDLNYQQAIVQLFSEWNRQRGVTVIFVTHDVNPLLAAIDRVLLLAGGPWAVGDVNQVLTSETLTRLYRRPVEVERIKGRVVVLGAELGGHEPLHVHGGTGR
ncbi:MAG TPA: ATP-binding cassette domain-containing protein [bacterium]|nr:ATP-binding cassette domain-containing protein [bacterium]